MTRYNGAIRTLEELKGRCVVDADTQCWHLRDSFGRAMKWAPKDVPDIYVHGKGKRSARRFAWEEQEGEEAPRGMYLAACAHAWDCVNPKHLKLVTPGGLGKIVVQTGKSSSPAKAAANLRNARKREHCKLTDELAAWIRESSQTQAAKAHALGVNQQRVSDVERWHCWKPRVVQQSSVFAWRPA